MPTHRSEKPLDIYVRVSRVNGRDGDSFISPEVQEERCRGKLIALGLQVGEVLIDLDESGGKESRPKFDLMKKRIEEGKSGGVIVWKLSRFGRRVQQVLRDIAWIEEQGATFVSVDPEVNTSTPFGKFILLVFAGLDELELDNLSAGWKTTKAKANARGIQIGVAPAGYSKDADRLLVPNEDAPAITAAFTLRASGASWATIVRHLNNSGVKSWRGSTEWVQRSASSMLDNDVYLGILRHGENVSPIGHEPLVDAKTWRKAQARKEVRGPNSRRDPAMLARLLRCGSCGHALTRDSNATSEFYTCKSKMCTKRVSINRNIVEPFIVARTVKLLAEWNVSSVTAVPDHTKAERVLAEARAEIAELDRMLAEGEIPATAYAKASAKAEANEAVAQADVDALDDAVSDDGFADLPRGVEITEELFLSLPSTVQNRYIRRYLPTDGITVRRGRGSVEERVVIGALEPPALALAA